MNHLALFNGIGGFQLAAHWAGWNNVAHCEIDDKCNQVVKKHFPNSICHTDIKQFNAKEYAGTIDIISGGFPCQGFSVAGKRKGKNDDRYLWPEYLRIIREIQPAWVVGENVTGIISMELDTVLHDLESEGYSCQTFIIPASGVGAWHQRERVWIIAQNPKYIRCNGGKRETKSGIWGQREFGTGDLQRIYPESNVSDNESFGMERIGGVREQSTKENAKEVLSECNYYGNGTNRNRWNVEPNVGRVANGIPGRVDRLKQLGNAIVPQVAYEIFKSIAEYENLYNENLYNQK